MAHRRIAASVVLVTTLILTLPVLARQKNVGPSSAGPRPNAVRPYVAGDTMLATPAGAQQKPFTQGQVSNMVRDGFGDESGAKLIEQRGIDLGLIYITPSSPVRPKLSPGRIDSASLPASFSEPCALLLWFSAWAGSSEQRPL